MSLLFCILYIHNRHWGYFLCPSLVGRTAISHRRYFRLHRCCVIIYPHVWRHFSLVQLHVLRLTSLLSRTVTRLTSDVTPFSRSYTSYVLRHSSLAQSCVTHVPAPLHANMMEFSWTTLFPSSSLAMRVYLCRLSPLPTRNEPRAVFPCVGLSECLYLRLVSALADRRRESAEEYDMNATCHVSVRRYVYSVARRGVEGPRTYIWLMATSLGRAWHSDSQALCPPVGTSTRFHVWPQIINSHWCDC